MSFLAELRRRNVFRVAVFYIVTTWLILQVIDVVGEILGLPTWLGKAVLLLLALGFVPALLFSWIYELTPEGLKREKDVVRDDSITQVTAKKLDIAVIVLLVAALGLLFYDRLGPDDSPARTAQIEAAVETAVRTSTDDGLTSVAVLPFVNMSADAENEYFSDGISEELLNVLVKIKGLRVSSRTSAFSFKGKDVDIPTVASALNVRHVVEGSVRRAGTQVRITAQLIDVETDSHLWSDTYTRELKDVFAIQDEIAGAIAQALQVELLGNAGQAVATHITDDVEAFEKYLLGRHYFHERTADSLPKAIELFEEVVAMDPGFPAAWSGIADAYLLYFQYGNMDIGEATRKARDAAERALDLDPNLAEAHASMGLAEAVARNPDASLAHLDRAIELNPGYSMAYIWKGNVMSRRNVAEALETFLAGERVDPLHPLYVENVVDVLTRMGRYEEAQVRVDRALAHDLDSWLIPAAAHHLYMAQGRLAEAHRSASQAVVRYPDSAVMLENLIDLELRLGRLESADFLLQQFTEAFPSNLSTRFLGLQRRYHAGELHPLLEMLTTMVDQVPPGVADSLRRGAGNLYLRLGDPEAALAIFAERGQESIDDQSTLEMLVMEAHARFSVGESENAATAAEQGLALAQQLRDRGSRDVWLIHAEAVLLAMADRVPEAESRFEESYGLGFRLREAGDLVFLLDHWLAGSSRYQQTQRAINADVARELARIEAEQA